MRAAIFQRPADGISIEEISVDPPRPGEIEVRMLAAGVCHSDLHIRDGDWPLDRPTVLGHEGAAEVAALGEGVEGLAP
ncbi:MAG: S-(hydroxymethyl)glutathione dehydrogenase / alcohol dehydrogenase, partial [Gaiellales bacterium]|nr:S-(hydroxymethyl)glutathione dehydrogenase / alcohol dehydrogenase [Gaiellales bacterium]